MIHLPFGEHHEGALTVPIFNYHLLAVKLGSSLGGEGWTRVACSRCGEEARLYDGHSASGAIREAFKADCAARNDP